MVEANRRADLFDKPRRAHAKAKAKRKDAPLFGKPRKAKAKAIVDGAGDSVIITRREALSQLAEFFIDMMESGDLPPWARSWRDAPIPISVRGRQYTGFNRLRLEGLAAKMRYRSPYWATKDWVEKLGGVVPKDAQWGELTETFDVRDRETREYTGDLATKVTYRVNVGEVFKEVPPWEPEPPDDERFKKARLIAEPYLMRTLGSRSRFSLAIFAKNPPPPSLEYNAAVRNPRYLPNSDEIEMPEHDRFYATDGFYHSLFHEIAHSTGHENRLNRPGVAEFDHFGSYQYSEEELVAQMTAAMLARYAGIDSTSEDMRSAAHLKSWLGRMGESPNMLYNAIDQSLRATNHLLRMKTGKSNSDGKPQTVGQALEEFRKREEKERKKERRQSR